MTPAVIVNHSHGQVVSHGSHGKSEENILTIAAYYAIKRNRNR